MWLADFVYYVPMSRSNSFYRSRVHSQSVFVMLYDDIVWYIVFTNKQTLLQYLLTHFHCLQISDYDNTQNYKACRQNII